MLSLQITILTKSKTNFHKLNIYSRYIGYHLSIYHKPTKVQLITACYSQRPFLIRINLSLFTISIKLTKYNSCVWWFFCEKKSTKTHHWVNLLIFIVFIYCAMFFYIFWWKHLLPIFFCQESERDRQKLSIDFIYFVSVSIGMVYR